MPKSTSEMHDDLPAVIDGRLMAQRHALVRLISHVAAGRDATWLDAAFPRDPVPQDGQEDPGAVPDRAFAILATRDKELALIAAEVRSILGHPPNAE